MFCEVEELPAGFLLVRPAPIGCGKRLSSSAPRDCPCAAPGPALTPPPAVLSVLPESFEWSVGDGALLEVGEPSEQTVVPGDPSATKHNIQYG